MKKITILSMLLVMLCTIFLVSCQNKTCTVTLIAKSEYQTIEVEKGTIFNYPEIKQDGYVFVGWYDNLSNKVKDLVVTQDIVLTGKYVKEGTKYTINYLVNGGELHEDTPFEYTVGEEVNIPSPYGFGKMQFLGWYNGDELVTSFDAQTFGNIELVAKWNDENVYYSLEYHLDGGIIEEPYKTNYIEGNSYKLPIPKKEGYLFKGWYLEEDFKTRIKKITAEDKQDYQLYAKFEEKIRENMYISFLGDSITTYAGYIPEGFATYYPTPGCDVDSVEKTWWHQVVTKTGYNLLMNNSYSGTQVYGDVYKANSYDRIKYLEKDDIDPDIVVIYMGTNDLTKGVTVEKFASAYASMIDKIKEEYDDVEIYVLNLPYNKYGTTFITRREQFNEKLVTICEEKGVELIDLTEAITKLNVHEMMFAGAHPSYQGMCVIADIVWKKIR